MNNRVRRASALSCLAAFILSLTLPVSVYPVPGGVTKTETHSQSVSSQKLREVVGASATFFAAGVLVRWQSDVASDNLGFNVYRMRDGKRIKLNREMILGSAFAPRLPGNARASYSYSFFDKGGSPDSTYVIESVNSDGNVSASEAISAVGGKGQLDQFEGLRISGSSESPRADESSYPTATETTVANGPIETQWDVASRPGVKIAIKRDGWYKITQTQVAATGFNPVVDIKNLQVFSDGRELAIMTNKASGTFVNGDSLEFYGRGLDTPTTDARTYYLIAGTSPGKRVRGDLVINGGPVIPPTVTPTSPGVIASPPRWFGFIVQFLNGLDHRSVAPVASPEKARTETQVPEQASEVATQNPIPDEPLPIEVVPAAKKTGKTKKKSKKKKRQYSHAPASAAATTSFTYSVERKERIVYFINLLNGDADNYFGAVLGGTPVTQALNTPNPEMTTLEPARLEVALQGVGFVPHQVNVTVNDVPVGSLDFIGIDRAVKVLSVPVSALNNGASSVKFTSATGGLCLVDYVRLTYPHALRADNNALRLSLRPSQSVTVDGFTSQNVRLIDVTDPFAVTVTRPIIGPGSGGGFAIQIPSTTTRAKARVLFAQLDSQADSPAAISLNTASTLNSAANAADLLIIAHKTLLASAAPLVTLRQSQGLAVAVVDVEDVYDEFDYGVHGPKALKNFLARTAASWATKPRYTILLGDASHDPRNYEGVGDLDLVPTKLVDATFSSTSSDDWLSDFNEDGLAEIAMGRLPARTAAEANLMISKIVSFAPANVPQTALLVADDPTGYYFDFEQANNEVQGFLPAGLVAQKVYRRNYPGGDSQARTDIVAKFNAGQTLVNYSGHGNVDTWTGGSIFNTNSAANLTNGNKLPFVVVMDCLNGYFQDPRLVGIAEALMKAPAGGSVATFASSGLTVPDGQHAMSNQLYTLLFGAQPIALGDAIRMSKAATTDIDVRHTWIFFGDPSMKLR